MLRIDNSTATEDNKFTDGNPSTATPATVVPALWLNVLQEELAHVVEESGGTLDQTGANTEQLFTAIQQLINDSLPDGETIGSVTAMAMDTPPEGWLECDGAAISRTTYADLFAAIGTEHGAGDGSTTFNVPDLRGEFIRGWDNGAGIDTGRAFGSDQLDSFQNFTGTVEFLTGGSGSPLLRKSAGDGVLYTSNNRTGTPSGITSVSTAANLNIDPSTNPTTRTSDETRPRNVALMYCIKY